ncbi:MAG: hypothetical protein R3F54_05045 [Alphaproteobacteria bacterium]
MDRIAETPANLAESKASGEVSEGQTTTYSRDWGQHPLNLRVTLPLPFGRWYVTLVAGRERRGKERLVSERKKHPLDTLPNVLFLLSIGIVSTTILLLTTAMILIHGFGWSINLTIPA